MADRRDPADGEAGQLVRLACARPADVLLAGDRRQPGQVDAVRARHEAQDRLGRAVLVGCDEDERLDDLAELGADRRGRLLGGVGRLGEDADLEAHALPGGGLPDALDPGMVGGLGHGGVYHRAVG